MEMKEEKKQSVNMETQTSEPESSPITPMESKQIQVEHVKEKTNNTIETQTSTIYPLPQQNNEKKMYLLAGKNESDARLSFYD